VQAANTSIQWTRLHRAADFHRWATKHLKREEMTLQFEWDPSKAARNVEKQSLV